MEGFVLAAGLGTRLRPLTDDRPKALVEVGGKTLLQHTIEKLQASGINHIVVNVHHFADNVVSFLRSRQWRCTIDISDERNLLLDTGGGLKHAAPLFSGKENVLVHNVDILSDIDLCDVEAQHKRDGNLVTLCVSQRQTKRLLEFDADGLLVGRAEQGLAFSGVSVVSPALFAMLPEADHPYPVIDEYIRLSRSHRIGCYRHSPDHWLDVGKPETLEQARQWTLSSAK
ncbi:MAG: nucleotidyltransferase family protein [Bacteroidales bacterium]|nr:nucleotidyltransferase family protein [Bacteroidales bacterium]